MIKRHVIFLFLCKKDQKHGSFSKYFWRVANSIQCRPGAGKRVQPVHHLKIARFGRTFNNAKFYINSIFWAVLTV